MPGVTKLPENKHENARLRVSILTGQGAQRRVESMGNARGRLQKEQRLRVQGERSTASLRVGGWECDDVDSGEIRPPYIRAWIAGVTRR